nr:immunoglobulin heavy chain junction region [Macaca mulatta]
CASPPTGYYNFLSGPW